MKKLGLLVAMSALVFVGCGDDDEGDDVQTDGALVDAGAGGDGGGEGDGAVVVDDGGNVILVDGAATPIDAATTVLTPTLIAGGGVKNGPIAGTLYVHVIDARTDAPVVGATVRVGTTPNAPTLTGTTNGAGLASFTDASLTGKQSITVTAVNRVPVTWIGVNGANVTIPTGLKTAGSPAVATANVMGTIAGWATLPEPAMGHFTYATISYSQTRELGGAENEIAQMPRLGGGTQNSCIRVRGINSTCSWTLVTRTGAQAHFAIILDVDTKSTATQADDTSTVIGFAVKRGVTLTANQTVTGEMLALIPMAETQTLNVAIPSAPSGLDVVQVFPALDLGAEGRIFVSALSPPTTTALIPRIGVGNFATATYDLIGRAIDGPADDQPSSLTWTRNVNVGAAVTMPGWLAAPANILVTGGNMISFDAVANATIYTVNLISTAPEGLWSIGIFDGTTSFTLPAISPDPVPTGTHLIEVGAIVTPGLNVQDFMFRGAVELLTKMSSDRVQFTK